MEKKEVSSTPEVAQPQADLINEMYVDGTASISIKNNKLEVIGANYSLKSGAVDFLT
jgi:hypothetical protein